MEQQLRRIDIGINLMSKQFNKDRADIVKKAHENGTGLIITGTDLESSQDAIKFVRKMRLRGYNNIWCTVGCHPHNAKIVDENYIGDLIKLIRDNKDIVVAVGECGLDYDRMFSTIEEQQFTFRKLQEVGERFELPLFLHERKAVEDFMRASKQHRAICRKSVVHCFTGSKETVHRYMQMGYYIGLTGWICDNRRNKEVLEALKIIPLERLLIETDAPYLTPLNMNGKALNLDRRNNPDNLKYVIEKIAEVKGVEPGLVEDKTLENTKKLFSI